MNTKENPADYSSRGISIGNRDKIVRWILGPKFIWEPEGCVCHLKLFKKSVSDHCSVDFLRKGRVFKLESLFRVSTLLYTSSLDF